MSLFVCSKKRQVTSTKAAKKAIKAHKAAKAARVAAATDSEESGEEVVAPMKDAGTSSDGGLTSPRNE
jgi:hypothetical protein